ncbi:MAG TPA: hypothetical protein VHU84_08350 [Lacipirellulaceae bacterium]|jgi:hypothetical protein|nr:hypothetical protein [Lacipirellulaceae bacterium]
MLRSKKRSVAIPSVKLYPRLASAKATSAVMRLDRPDVRSRRSAVASPDSRDSELDRLRTRLLKMILDNERARSHNWRPRVS